MAGVSTIPAVVYFPLLATAESKLVAGLLAIALSVCPEVTGTVPLAPLIFALLRVGSSPLVV